MCMLITIRLNSLIPWDSPKRVSNRVLPCRLRRGGLRRLALGIGRPGAPFSQMDHSEVPIRGHQVQVIVGLASATSIHASGLEPVPDQSLRAHCSWCSIGAAIHNAKAQLLRRGDQCRIAAPFLGALKNEQRILRKLVRSRRRTDHYLCLATLMNTTR